MPTKSSPSLQTYSIPSLLLPAAALESSLLSVFSCAILAVLMPLVDSKYLPFLVILILRKNQESHSAFLRKIGTQWYVFSSYLSSGWCSAAAVTRFFFLFHLRKTLGKEDSRDTSESSKNNGISVFAVKGEILRKFTATCILVHLVCA